MNQGHSIRPELDGEGDPTTGDGECDPTTSTDDRDPTVVRVDEPDADGVFAALSSGTAQSILGELHESPKTPSELTDRVGTTLQNVHHHLSKLEDCGLITVAGTEYSSKGAEMKVYAPDGELVIVFGDLDEVVTGPPPDGEPPAHERDRPDRDWADVAETGPDADEAATATVTASDDD